MYQMANNKNSFVLYCDLIKTVSKLPNEKAGELFKHLLEYVNDLNPETDDLLLQIAFEPIKQSLKRDLIKYESRANRSRENGKLGGRPKNPEKPKEPTGLIKNPKKPRKPDSDSDSVSVNETVIKEDKALIFNSWLSYRKEIKKPIKAKSTLNGLIKTFNETKLAQCEIVVNYSIENGYQGLFWDRTEKTKPTNVQGSEIKIVS